MLIVPNLILTFWLTGSAFYFQISERHGRSSIANSRPEEETSIWRKTTNQGNGTAQGEDGKKDIQDLANDIAWLIDELLIWCLYKLQQFLVRVQRKIE